MAEESFEKESLSWQFDQLKTRLSEWWELQFSKLTRDKSPNDLDLSWLNSEIFLKLAQIIFWIILIVLMVWIIWQLWRFLRPYFYYFREPRNQAIPQDVSRPHKLLSISDWVTRAQQFQKQGQYQQACICLYQAMLEFLNTSQKIPHLMSRTDGEYLKLIKKLPRSIPYQTLILTHQELSFSKIDATIDTWEKCQKAYQQIQQDS
jgi:hypothetical protein